MSNRLKDPRAWAWTTSLAIGTAGAFVLWRVLGINPAILGDEWVYLVSARHYEIWSAEAAGLGNYLFNFIYKGTLLCGDGFYQCAKGLNLSFFLLFVVFLILTLRDYANKWLALLFGLGVLLSPLSVYVSMFLPETLFFAMIGGAVFSLSKALQADATASWAWLGVFLGLAALTKPHALISAMGMGLFLLLYVFSRQGPLLLRLRPLTTTIGVALVTRFGLGFVLGGPATLSLFTSYNTGEALATIASTGTEPEMAGESLIGAGQVIGALGLFPDQIIVHIVSIAAIAGAAVTVVIARFLTPIRREEAKPVDQLALSVLIWLGAMVVAIVLFTGWITGGGDDHTTRVLLRYYDFLIPVMFLVAIALVSQGKLNSVTLFARWAPSALFMFASAVAFTGFFNSLTVQIADAPFLAGLIVDRFVYDSVSIIGFSAVLVLAFFPRHLLWSLTATMAITFPMMGFTSQDQYISFRGQDNGPDEMGKFAYEAIPSNQRDLTTVIAQTRFDGRTISFWMDADNDLLLVSAGTAITKDSFDVNHEFLVVDSTMELGPGLDIVSELGGYRLVQVSGD